MEYEAYKDFLLNLFIILAPLVFFQFLFKWNLRGWRHGLFVYILCLLPLVFTMSFPVEMFSTILDLRSIPLVIGSLYGGIYTTVMLFASVVIYRDMIGALGTFHYILALLPTFSLIVFFLKRFDAYRVRARVGTAIGCMLFLRISVVVIYYELEGIEIAIFDDILLPSLPVIAAQSLLAGFIIYVLEAMRSSIKLREEVVKAEKIKLVSDIAASVAHEVRNPLTAVRGFIQLLGNDKLSEDKRKRYTKICIEELDRAQTIISDYLSLAKPEQEHKEALIVKDQLDYVSNILSAYANYQNVKIKVHMHHDAVIYGNQSKFRQALINIGKNGIDAMPDGGVLAFRGEVSGKALILRISDTGVGMTAAQINRLGTPYYSTKEKGTGLGTMVTFSIIRQMSGSIEVSSAPGEGTTYTITIPLLQSSA